MDKAKVSMKEARADIQLKAGHPLEPGTLRLAVVGAGFTPTWIRFEAVGQLVVRNGNPAFKVQGTEQVIPLVADERLEALRQAAGPSGKLVVIMALMPPEKETAQVEEFELR